MSTTAADFGSVTATVTSGAAATADVTCLGRNERDFLSQVIAWPTQGESGYANLHYSMVNPKPTPAKPPLLKGMGWPFRDLGKFVSRAEWVNGTTNFKDVWFCTSLQSTMKKDPKTGKLKAVRLANNALKVKSIWIDMDVGPNDPKKYATIQDALKAVIEFRERVGLPPFSAIVGSGSGIHVYWISETALTPEEWKLYSHGLKTLLLQNGVKCDAGLTIDIARILRVPGTLNHKYNPPRPVQLLNVPLVTYNFGTSLSLLTQIAPQPSAGPGTAKPQHNPFAEDANMASFTKPAFKINEPDLNAGIGGNTLLKAEPIFKGCGFLRDARTNGGADYDNPLWNLSVLCASFMENGNAIAHEISKGHAKYTHAETQQHYERKIAEKERGLGWPSCATIQNNGCKACATCRHFPKRKSPLNLGYQEQGSTEARASAGTTETPQAELSFVDPYAEFVGPEFPLAILPPTLANFVDAEHRAMGADRSAIAMAALTAVAGAMHADAQVRVGEGWWEKPILWGILVGPPSAMKSPIIDKVSKPLSHIDHERSTRLRQAHAKWLQDKKVDKTVVGPVKPPRCLINDATPEKVAEILSRDPSGSLMVHDELAGWLGSFERYNSGSSRAFFLSCWNGGTFTKDRVGNGRQDADAEICVDNLALGILGGIQPDRLTKLGDLTSDGLLQRFLIVLMKCADRGDQDHPVAGVEAEYEKLIRSINGAPPQNYRFADDALEVRDRMMDYLHMLELVGGFPASLIGAIGKLKGYFARISLVLHIAKRHDASIENAGHSEPLDPSFTAAAGEQLRKLLGLSLDDRLSTGINVNSAISRRTAEAAEKLIREFLLPNCFGFYDVVVNGGRERDKLRSIADFILTSSKGRLRPSDFTAGVRTLRGEPEQKIQEWVGRFCGMDWLVTEEGRPGAPPKAWQVAPGLREHFSERRKQAQAARAEAHAILAAGGSRRSA